MKRVLSLLLCIVMCVSAFSATAVQTFAANKAESIFTVDKTEFKNDTISYTLSLNANQTDITGFVLKVKFDSNVLSVASDSGPVTITDPTDDKETILNVDGIYENGIAYNDAGTYAIAYVNPNGFNIGEENKQFFKIIFVALGDARPVTDVEFYCEEFITEDGNASNDITINDDSPMFYSDSFFSLSAAKNVAVESSEKGLKFTWSQAQGAEWYKIYRKTSASDWIYLTQVQSDVTEYVDEDVKNGVEYFYSVETGNEYGVREYNKTGIKGFYFGTITDISIAQTQRGAMISWDAINGAESYTIHRNEDGATNEDGSLIWEEIEEVKGITSYEDEPLTNGVQYKYTVKAHKGEYTAEASVEPVTITFVANADIVYYQLNYSDIVINWNTVGGAVGYEVYRKAEGETKYTLKDTRVDNGYTDTDVTDGKTYSYQVRTITETGSSILGEKGYDILKLPITTQVVATLGDGNITVSWKPVELAEQYIVYRKTTTGNWMRVATIPATSAKYEDEDVENGDTYIYAIQSKANRFTTELSTVSDSVFYIDAPTINSISNNTKSLEINFDKVDIAEKYNIYRKQVNGKFGKPIATIVQTDAKKIIYEDSTIVPGVQYIYGIESVKGSNKSVISQSEITCCLGKPNLEIEVLCKGIELTWNDVAGAEKYNVYHRLGSKGEPALVATVSGTSFVHDDAESGLLNAYEVEAVCGNTTNLSNKESVYYIAAIEDIEIKNGKSSVQLKWLDDPAISDYIVYRKNYGDAKWTKISPTIKKESEKIYGETVEYIICEDKNVTAGKKYVYTVVSSDGEDFSARNETGWTIEFLKNPTIKSVENYYGGPKITWSKATGAAKYEIYRKTKSSSWKKIGSTKSTSYVDKSAKSDTKYYYAVKSVDGTSTSYHSTSHFNDICKTVNYLAAPVVKVENTTSAISVTWGKISGAQKYEVYRKAGSAKKWTKVKTTTSRSYTDKSVKNGTTYKYMVKAIDGKIVSGYDTDGVSLKRLSAPKLSSVSSSKTGITFKWKKVSGASGYIVYRKEGSGSYKELAKVKGSTKVSYVDKKAKKGKTYTYTVKAYSGSSKSAYNSGLKIKDKY